MTIKNPSIIIILACFAHTMVFGQCIKSIQKVSESAFENSDDMFLYSLPKTAITVQVSATKMIYKPGIYAEYAEELLGITNPIIEEYTAWTLDSISIGTKNVIDTALMYVIKADKGFCSQSLTKCSEKGMILYPTFCKNAMIDAPSNPTIITYPHQKKWQATATFKAKADTLYHIIYKDTITVRVPYFCDKIEEKSTKEKAIDAVKLIMKIRKRKTDALVEDDPIPDAETLRYATTEMEKLEASITALFTGEIEKETFIYHYSYVPVKTADSLFQVCSFTKDVGIIQNDTLHSVPVNIHIDNKNITRVFAKMAKPNLKQCKNSILYRIPEIATVSITVDHTLFAAKQISLFQRGSLFLYPLTN